MKLNYLIWALIVVWAVGVYADEPPTYTVKQIQQYQGVNEGDRVKVTGIVTVESARYGYSVTVICDPGGGPWAGIAVYDRDQRLVAERGNTVEVVGIVQEYYDKTEINCSDETEFPPVVTGNGTVPDPIEVTTGSADQEQYESCLIMLRNVEVQSNPDQYGNIAIDDGTGEFTLLLRKIDPAPAVGYVYDCLIGDDDYHFGEFKIRPRDENDWVCPGGAPTPTPPPDATPTPTPSGSSACDPSIELFFEGHDPNVCFQAGDTFHARFHILNPCMEDKSMDLYIVLEVAGMYFFFPNWTQELSSSFVSVRADGEILDDIMPPFEWPSGVGAYSGLYFYGIMAEPGTYNVIGNVAVLEFCYQ